MRGMMLPIVALALAGTAQAQAGTAASGVATPYTVAKRFLVAAAEQMPEADYSFRATEQVRTFGEVVGHVADANYMLCSTAAGEENPNKDKPSFEKTTAKADLIKALKDSFTYCDGKYGMADAKALEEVTLFGMKTNRVGVLAFNAAHEMEHYGNIVTYMRLKGMVPPSSQR